MDKDIVGTIFIITSILLNVLGIIFVPKINEPIPLEYSSPVVLIVAIFLSFGFGLGLLMSPKTNEVYK